LKEIRNGGNKGGNRNIKEICREKKRTQPNDIGGRRETK
jgi:hypothetical protein